MSREKEGGVDGCRIGEAVIELGSFFMFNVAVIDEGSEGCNAVVVSKCGRCRFQRRSPSEIPSRSRTSPVEDIGIFRTASKNLIIDSKVQHLVIFQHESAQCFLHTLHQTLSHLTASLLQIPSTTDSTIHLNF